MKFQKAPINKLCVKTKKKKKSLDTVTCGKKITKNMKFYSAAISKLCMKLKKASLDTHNWWQKNH